MGKTLLRTDITDIYEFASHILFSECLEDKLRKPIRLKEAPQTVPKAFTPPDTPGRPPELRFSPKQLRQPFPKVHDVSPPEVRGKILHYFANHELLAIELMALALLKFPDSPSGFKQEILALIAQEQNHLRLYMQRMSELGVQFGEIPVNDFFWRVIAPLKTPLSYISHLNLGFEQANLDFALHYEKLFADVGDTVTAQLMRRVYLEEIGHVAHGVKWFENWRPSQETQWQTFCDQLDPPFSPANAKGLGFDEAGRSKAGLERHYIEHLKSFKKQCKSFYFNPSVELEVTAQHSHFTAPKPRQIFAQDFAWCMSFLGDSHDQLIAPATPTESYRQDMKDYGFPTPKVVASPTTKKVSQSHPWGWSPVSRRVFDQQQETLFIDKIQAANIFREFYQEHHKTLKLGPPELLPVTLTTPKEVTDYLMQARQPCVLKSPLGAGGQGNLVLQSHKKLGEREHKWIEKCLHTHKCLIAEPWLDKVCDWGQQIFVQPQNHSYWGLTRYETDAQGQLQHYILNNPQLSLPPAVIQAINGHGKSGHSFFHILELARHYVSKCLHQLNYQGPAGIDCFIFQHDQQLFIRPIVEINSRYTFGHVALRLQVKIARGSIGLWYFKRRHEITKQYPDFKTFAATQKKPHLENGKLQSGVIFTNDPATAKDTLGVLEVKAL